MSTPMAQPTVKRKSVQFSAEDKIFRNGGFHKELGQHYFRASRCKERFLFTRTFARVLTDHDANETVFPTIPFVMEESKV